MAGIQPFSGELKKRIDREAAQCHSERLVTITGLEMEIRHLKGRLDIAHADLHHLKATNEELRDSICTRPLNPKRSWEMPEAPECPYCSATTRPFAVQEDEWVLGFICCSCHEDYKIRHRIEWPFDSNQAVYPSDMERLGFLVSNA